MNCSMGLKLYKVDGARGGDCINCLKCTEVCPRNNANVNILGQDLNQNLAGSVAMAAMLGVYGITNFGVDALTKSGIISNNSAISSNETSKIKLLIVLHKSIKMEHIQEVVKDFMEEQLKFLLL